MVRCEECIQLVCLFHKRTMKELELTRDIPCEGFHKSLDKQIIAELDRIRDNLRIKGDQYKAQKVENFKKRFFPMKE